MGPGGRCGSPRFQCCGFLCPPAAGGSRGAPDDPGLTLRFANIDESCSESSSCGFLSGLFNTGGGTGFFVLGFAATLGGPVKFPRGGENAVLAGGVGGIFGFVGGVCGIFLGCVRISFSWWAVLSGFERGGSNGASS